MVKQKDFTWGKIIKVHQFNDIEIVEHKSTFKGDEGKIYFQIYIGGKDCSTSSRNLDTAMLVALANKYDGWHSHAVPYIVQMLGMPKD
jgi:sulfite reductase beta subunit-like hemoprotein